MLEDKRKPPQELKLVVETVEVGFPSNPSFSEFSLETIM